LVGEVNEGKKENTVSLLKKIKRKGTNWEIENIL
jgi:hypothetical protein